jgi:hypothetical protein
MGPSDLLDDGERGRQYRTEPGATSNRVWSGSDSSVTSAYPPDEEQP